MSFKKSQTATEYLIILAVVIVIALIVVGVLGGIPSIGGGSSSSAKKLLLKNEIVGLENYYINSTYAKLKIRNNNPDSTVNINNITIDGNYCDANGSISLKVGESKIIECNGTFIDYSDEKQIPNVRFYYTVLKNFAKYETKGTGVSNSAAGLVSSEIPFGFKSICGGYAHLCVVLNNGSLACWGYGYGGNQGQMGLLSGRINQPTLSPGISGVSEVSCARTHTCLLYENGSVACMGDDAYGQLGNGATTGDKNTPQFVGIDDAVQVITGAWESYALHSDGTVSAWGYNTYGVLGLGDTSHRSSPQKISGLSNVIEISANGGHWTGGGVTCALHENKTVSCWGYSSTGLVDSQIPIAMGVSNVEEIVAGGLVMRLNNGSIYEYTDALYQITPLSDVSSMGDDSGCFVHNTGSISCYYSDNQGKLGNGDPYNTAGNLGRYEADQVLYITNAEKVGSTPYNRCAILSNNTLWCWGDNNDCQLGYGTCGGDIPYPVEADISLLTD